MTIELTVLISIVCAVLGGCIGVLGYRRNRNKDIAADAKSDGIVLTEIGYIKSGVDDIKSEQRLQRDEFVALKVDVAEVKASTKQAHKRLDRFEGKE